MSQLTQLCTMVSGFKKSDPVSYLVPWLVILMLNGTKMKHVSSLPIYFPDFDEGNIKYYGMLSSQYLILFGKIQPFTST